MNSKIDFTQRRKGAEGFSPGVLAAPREENA